jgi:hypothetical protein
MLSQAIAGIPFSFVGMRNKLHFSRPLLGTAESMLQMCFFGMFIFLTLPMMFFEGRVLRNVLDVVSLSDKYI